MAEVSTIPLFSANKIESCFGRACVTVAYVTQSGREQNFEISIELMF